MNIPNSRPLSMGHLISFRMCVFFPFFIFILPIKFTKNIKGDQNSNFYCFSEACNKDLGMQSRKIPDSNIIASSAYKPDVGSEKAR